MRTINESWVTLNRPAVERFDGLEVDEPPGEGGRSLCSPEYVGDDLLVFRSGLWSML